MIYFKIYILGEAGIPAQATIEVPDEEKKVFVGGLPHDCKHEDVEATASKSIGHFAVFWTSMFVHFAFSRSTLPNVKVIGKLGVTCV